MKFAVLAILASPLAILAGTAIVSATEVGRPGILNAGPHGFSEIFYSFASTAGNNGSAFGGLTANTDFYTYAHAIAMLVGRFAVIIPVLAIAGSLAAKPAAPASVGAFPTSGPLFIGLLACVILVVGALTFLPALAVGPLAEATAISFATPAIVALLSALLLRERIPAVNWLALLLASAGVAIVLRPNFADLGLVALMPLVAAFSMAGVLLVNRATAQDVSPVAPEKPAAFPDWNPSPVREEITLHAKDSCPRSRIAP